MEHIRDKVQSGFSLIELLITLAIMAVMVRLAAPNYAVWMGNQHIRAGAESVIGAVNLARNEAMKRNGRVLFEFTDAATNSPAWRVCPVARNTIVCDPAQAEIQNSDGGEESGRAQIGMTTNVAMTNPGAFGAPLAVGGGPGGVLFDGIGRPNITAGYVNLSRVDVRNVALASADERRLVIVIGGAGSARACDPLTVAPNPRAC